MRRRQHAELYNNAAVKEIADRCSILLTGPVATRTRFRATNNSWEARIMASGKGEKKKIPVVKERQLNSLSTELKEGSIPVAAVFKPDVLVMLPKPQQMDYDCGATNSAHPSQATPPGSGCQALYFDRPANWQAYQIDISRLGKNDSQLIGKTKRLAIVGCSDSKSLAPYDDPDIEIWSVNNAYGHIKRYSRWFEIHTIEFDKEKGHFSRRWNRDFRGLDVDAYLSHLAALDCPVYMQKHWDVIPKSIAYPLDALIKHFGGDRYFTNTISYQIALAMFEGFKEVQVWGVDMAVDCLAPETKVLTADLQWVPSGNVKVGDELMGFDEYPTDGEGKTRRWRKTTVTKARETQRPCFELGLEDGTSFIASEKHGWLTHSENVHKWKTSDQLMTKHHRGCRPTRILKMCEPWKEIDSWDAGYLAAAFDGEGSFCQNERPDMPGIFRNFLSFAQRENEMMQRVCNILDKYEFKYTVCTVGDRDTKQINIKGGKPAIMRFLGQFRPPRLLPKFKSEAMGEFSTNKHVAVVESRPIGMHTVMGIETDKKTFISEGLASHNSEYHWQRPSVEYWIGMAKGMGIKIYVPPTADLLKTRFLYAFEERPADEWKQKLNSMLKALQTRKNESMQRAQIEHDKIQQYIGAEAAAKEIDKIWK